MNDSLSVCIVEDRIDDAIPLEMGLNRLGIESRLFATAEALLASDALEQAHCVILDIGLPGMSGLNLQSELIERQSVVPVIVVSGSALVSDAICAFEFGARAFFEKPVELDRLLDATQQIAETERKRRLQESERSHRLALLSPRELEVLEQLIAGTSVKSIGRNLGISPSTAEKHRASVLLKTGFDNLIELTRFVLTGVPSQPTIENFATRRFDRPATSSFKTHLPGARVLPS